MFNIYDENNELMRVVKSLAEAKYQTLIRKGWTYKKVNHGI